MNCKNDNEKMVYDEVRAEYYCPICGEVIDNELPTTYLG